jgi:putative tryptophan/tyrosine transport system substrate-binding protein
VNVSRSFDYSDRVTGINIFSAELTAQRLELLRKLVPAATRVAVLVNPANAVNTQPTLRDVQSAAGAMGLQIQVLEASTSREINAAFVTFVRERPDALFVGSDPFLTSRRVQLVQLATLHKVPATFSNRDFVEAGGLMSYGSNLPDAWRPPGGLLLPKNLVTGLAKARIVIVRPRRVGPHSGN